jgi:hypothetical protein
VIRCFVGRFESQRVSFFGLQPRVIECECGLRRPAHGTSRLGLRCFPECNSLTVLSAVEKDLGGLSLGATETEADATEGEHGPQAESDESSIAASPSSSSAAAVAVTSFTPSSNAIKDVSAILQADAGDESLRKYKER